MTPDPSSISARGEERLRGGHPWIYRADVADARAAAGDIVQVRSPRGQMLGLGALQRPIADHAAHADATARRVADEALVRRRIEAAIAFRESLAIDATAYRLVHGEADLLPSLIVDRYGDYLVVQALSQGMDRLLPVVVSALTDLLHPRGILARNDPRARAARRPRAARGRAGRRGARQRRGHRDRRRSTTSICGTARRPGCSSISARTGPRPRAYARGRMLDCFSYNGGFALVLGRRCDETIAFDVSEDAVARVQAERRAQRRGRRRARRQRVRRAARARPDRRAVRHDRPRPAGVRQEQGGGRRTRGPATRRSTSAR